MQPGEELEREMEGAPSIPKQSGEQLTDNTTSAGAQA